MSDDTQALKELSGEQLAYLVVQNAVGFAIFVLNLGGNIVSWNSGAERLLGWREEEAVGQHSALIFTSDDRAAEVPQREIDAAKREGRAIDERWHVRRDGTCFWASGQLIRLDDDITGQHIGYAKIIQDRTHEHELFQQKRSDERRLRLALEGARMACWEYDISEQRLVATPELPAVLGLSEEQVADQEFVFSRYYPGDQEMVNRTGAEAVARGEDHFEVEFRFYDAEDRLRWLMLRAEALRNERGQPERVLGVCLDVTNRKATELELRALTERLEEEVEKRTRDLLEAEEALRQSQKMEALGQLTGGLAHDFNNLLTIIRSSAELLQTRQLAEEKRARYLNAITTTTERAAKMTSQLLSFARRQTLKPQLIDVGEVTTHIIDVIRTLVGPRIRLHTRIECERCHVQADLAQYESAIVNLAVNARDAMDGEGELTISISTPDGLPSSHRSESPGQFAAISVQDTGCGISPENLQRIFEPFFTTKELGKGTGLGLSQVYGFAKQSGGEVAVESRLGGGSTFTLYLPRTDSPIGQPASQEERFGHGTQLLRILLVEDNAEVGAFAEGLLEDLGHTVTRVTDASAALSLLQDASNKYDVLFTDVVMPGMSGLELAQTVRRSDPDLRIVLTSGYSQDLAEQGSHGFELLQKPYSLESLARTLQGIS